MPTVLDASVALAWCFPDAESDFAHRLFDGGADDREMLAPTIWLFEVANALIGRQRHRRLDESQAARARALLKQLPLTVMELAREEMLGDVTSLALAHGLSAYDASYLHLAIREGRPLATLDQRLRNAAEAAGCEVLR